MCCDSREVMLGDRPLRVKVLANRMPRQLGLDAGVPVGDGGPVPELS
jgi:hypothetical protein